MSHRVYVVVKKSGDAEISSYHFNSRVKLLYTLKDAHEELRIQCTKHLNDSFVIFASIAEGKAKDPVVPIVEISEERE